MSENSQFRHRFNEGVIVNRLRKNPSNFSKDKVLETDDHIPILTQQNFKEQCGCDNSSPHILKSSNSQHFLQLGNSCSELMKVLLEENSNLKDQNMYLQRQLNKFIYKQKDLSETVMEYQTIMSVLNAENIRLHRQLLQFSQNCNYKVDKLKTTINQFFKNKKDNTYDEQQDTFTITPSCEQYQEDRKFKRNKSEQAFIHSRSQKIPSKVLYTNPSTSQFSWNKNPNVQQEYPFELLLEQCRGQPNPQKRKEMRKILMQLAHKQSSQC